MSAIGDLLTSLAACLCVEYPDEFCFCGILPGAQTPVEVVRCDDRCGMGWVRLTSAYPAVAAGQTPLEGQACASLLGADIQVGVIRCLEYPDDGQPPTQETLEAATLQQMEDMTTIRRVIECCDALDFHDHEINTYTPHGPQGMVVGGWWSLSVAI